MMDEKEKLHLPTISMFVRSPISIYLTFLYLSVYLDQHFYVSFSSFLFICLLHINMILSIRLVVYISLQEKERE